MKKFRSPALAVLALLLAFALAGCCHINGIALPQSQTIYVGGTYQMVPTYTTREENTDSQDVADTAQKLVKNWSSSDATVASVDDKGLVTAVKKGTADITVSTISYGDTYTAVCHVTVETALTDLTATKSITLYINGKNSDNVGAKLVPSDVVGVTIKYTSSNEKVAGVDATGKVTAVSDGQCIITSTAVANDPNTTLTDDFSAQTKVTVKTAPIKLMANDISLYVGKTANITVSTDPATVSAGTTYTYESTTPAVATVDADGLVTGVAAGTATINIKNELGTSISITVTVRRKVVTPPAATPAPDAGSEEPAASSSPSSSSSIPDMPDSSSSSPSEISDITGPMDGSSGSDYSGSLSSN